MSTTRCSSFETTTCFLKSGLQISHELTWGPGAMDLVLAVILMLLKSSLLLHIEAALLLKTLDDMYSRY
ncbi:hypothetical protein E3N88_34849 [Mikania micrantha]|uniref:Uncharacterized protein n=1 Tax=Mikania micrantha TaxID=192012 RepID=A0A5N6LZA9_9ASTR|nr:hypothetical protein E3N88_34849 [Mikania micrantha]